MAEKMGGVGPFWGRFLGLCGKGCWNGGWNQLGKTFRVS